MAYGTLTITIKQFHYLYYVLITQNDILVQCSIHSPIMSIMSRNNPIPHIDTYFFRRHSNIVLPPTPTFLEVSILQAYLSTFFHSYDNKPQALQPVRALDYQPTAGLSPTYPQPEVKKHLASLGLTCGQHVGPPTVVGSLSHDCHYPNSSRRWVRIAGYRTQIRYVRDTDSGSVLLRQYIQFINLIFKTINNRCKKTLPYN